jgi:hypothetical protein
LMNLRLFTQIVFIVFATAGRENYKDNLCEQT